MKFTTKKIAISGMVMALYVAVMYCTQTFASGMWQIRIATSIYALGAMFPFLIVPLGLANCLSNLLFGLGPIDVVFGLIIGLMTAGGCYLVKRFKLNDWLIALPIWLLPGLCAPIWLSFLIPGVTYMILVSNLIIAQAVCGVVGVILYKTLMKYRGQLHV